MANLFSLRQTNLRRTLTAENFREFVRVAINEENYGEEPDRDADFDLTPEDAIAMGQWLLAAGHSMRSR